MRPRDQDGNHTLNVRGKYYSAGAWHTYDVASAFDERNRRVYKSFFDNTTSKFATWFFSYDGNNRLVEVTYTPDTASPSSYSVFQMFWLRDRLVLYWQVDYPSTTTSRRYVGTDESGRPIDMWSWPSTGDGSRVWTVNPRAWAVDTNGVGPAIFQPIMFVGQYQDAETTAYIDSSGTNHRPGVALNGFRTYDPFTGGYLQVDPLVDASWSTYVYAHSNPVGKRDRNGLLDSVLCSDTVVDGENTEDEVVYPLYCIDIGNTGGHTGGTGGGNDGGGGSGGGPGTGASGGGATGTNLTRHNLVAYDCPDGMECAQPRFCHDSDIGSCKVRCINQYSPNKYDCRIEWWDLFDPRKLDAYQECLALKNINDSNRFTCKFDCEDLCP